jgi:hypothetical protein
MAAIAILLGFFLIAFRSHTVAEPVLGKIWIGEFYGQIEAVENISARNVYRLRLATGGSSDLPPFVRVNLIPEQYQDDFQPGAIIRLRARLLPPAGPTLPGGYDFARRAWFQQIGATGTALGELQLFQKAENGAWFATQRAVLTEHILASMPQRSGAIGAALVTGDQGHISPADAQAMRDSLKPLAAQMESPLTTLALSLQPQQLETMQARFAKDNTTWRKDWKLDASSQDRLDAQTEKGQRNAERFYGKVSKAQQAQLRLLAQSSGFEPERAYAERLRQQADSLLTLKTIALGQRGMQSSRQLVSDWLQRSLNSPDDEYVAYLKKRQTLNCDAAAQFHNSTSPEQRAHAVNLLKSYEADLRELMRTSP